MCVFARGIFVPSQERERSCLCVLGVSLYQVRKVSNHVFVCVRVSLYQARKVSDNVLVC